MSNCSDDIPVFPNEIITLERLGNNKDDYVILAWKITLQVVEHIFNSIDEKDSYTNEHLPTLLSDFLDKLSIQLESKQSVPLPNDYLYQLINYGLNSFEEIFKNPKRNIIKEHEMMPVQKVTSMSTKTMNWIGKIPGRTIKEKLSNKPRILGQLSKFTLNTKENRVYVRVLKELSKLVTARIDYGIKNRIYYYCENEEIYKNVIKFHKLANIKLKNSEMSEIRPSVNPEPNNVLISDRKYSVVWRCWLKLMKYETIYLRNWRKAYDRYMTTIYWAVISDISQNKYFKMTDNLAVIAENTSGKIDIKLFKEGAFLTENAITFYVLDKSLKGVIKTKVVQQSKKFGFIKNVQGDYYFDPTSISSEDIFNNLKVGQSVLFSIRENKNSRKEVSNIYFSVPPIFYIKITLDCNIITLEVNSQELVNNLYEITDTKIFTYRLNFNENLKNKRGIAFSVKKSIDDVESDIYEYNNYADCAGIKDFPLKIYNELLSELKIGNFKRSNNSLQCNKAYENTGFDFSTYLPLMTDSFSSNINFITDFYAVVFGSNSGDKIKIAKKNHLYNIENKFVHLNSLISFDVTDDLNLNIYNEIIESIKNEITLTPDNYFSYSVPDIIDEFSQKNLKSIFRVYFKNSFPVWRSIAGAFYLHDNSNKVKLKEDDTLLIFDTHSSVFSTTILKTKHNKTLNNLIFEHFPPLPYEDIDERLSFKNMQKIYIEKYFLNLELSEFDIKTENLINSGMVEKIILNQEEFILPLKIGKSILISYDQDIWNQVYDEWIANIHNYLFKFRFDDIFKSLFESKKKKSRQIIIFLSDFISENDSNLSKAIQDVFNWPAYCVIKNADIVTGSSLISNRLKRLLPTWEEWLPDLSIEIIKDGHFDEIQLIKENSIELFLGAEKIFEIDEVLTIPADNKTIKFPLLSGLSSGNSIDYEAVINDKCLPLKNNIDVKLSIKYKCGYENSYELLLTPLKPEDAPFKTITVEWKKEKEEKIAINDYPKFPSKKALDDDKILSIIERIRDFANYFSMKCNKFLTLEELDSKELIGMGKRIREFDSNFMYLASNKNDIRVYNFISEELFKSEFILWIGKIAGVKNYILVQNPTKEFFELRNQAILLLSSLGDFVPKHAIEFLIGESKNNLNKTTIMALGRLLKNDNFEIFLDIIIKILKNAIDENDIDIINQIISSISSRLWQNSMLIISIYKKYPEVISIFLTTIEKDLKRVIYRILKEMPKDKNDQKWWVYTSVYRDSSEFILAILRLREFTNEFGISIGCKRMKNIAKYIRKIDYLMYKLDWEIKSRVMITVDKPEILRNMSDLGFVLNAYLTGDTGKSRIQITGYND